MNRWIAPFVLLSVAAIGCGGNYSQAAARDAATTQMCKCYDRAGKVGSGQKYENLDSCEIDQRAFWNDAWPVKDCDGRIKSEDLATCLKAIEITDCNNGFDTLNTVFNKCSSGAVCKG